MRALTIALALVLLPACLHGTAPLVPGPDGAADSGDAPAVEVGVPPSDGTIGIATFNVRRYFDTACDSGSCGGKSYEVQTTPEAFEARTQQLADAVLALGVDVVLLQEVENQVCLDALGGRLGDAFPVRVLGEIHTPASVDVAILARGSLLEVLGHRADTRLPLGDGTTTTFSRELLEVRLDLDGAQVIVLNAHFKSKSYDDPERRLAEAKAAREIVLATVAAQPGSVIVLGGDLNDTPSSEPLQALEGDGGLFRIASSLPPGADWTYLWGDSAQAIDHLYFATGGAGVVVEGSVEIMRDEDGVWGGSDHAAVRARIRLP